MSNLAQIIAAPDSSYFGAALMSRHEAPQDIAKAIDRWENEGGAARVDRGWRAEPSAARLDICGISTHVQRFIQPAAWRVQPKENAT